MLSKVRRTVRGERGGFTTPALALALNVQAFVKILTLFPLGT